MSKKKGTLIDLSQLLDNQISNGLPTKPRNRDPNNNEQFQRKQRYNNYNQGERYKNDKYKWSKNNFYSRKKNSKFRKKIKIDKVEEQILESKLKEKKQEELLLKKKKFKKDNYEKKKKEKQVEDRANLKVLEDERNKVVKSAIYSQNYANKIIESGIKGNELNEFLKKNRDITARSMATAILNEKIKDNNLTDYKWLQNDEYGSCLKKLIAGKGSIQSQSSILYACQDAYQKENLPTFKNEVTGKKESHFEKLLFELWNKEIIEDLEAFNEWRYGDDELDLVKSKKDVLFQISNFLQWLDEPPEEDSEENSEENNSTSIDDI